MADEEVQVDAADVEDVEEIPEETDAPPPTKQEKPKRTPEEQLDYLEGRAQRLRTKLGLTTPRKAKETAPKEPDHSKTGELDDTQLDYLDLKGITEQEDIDIIQRVMQRTGVSLRQALKDEYVVSKLAANKADRDVKAATPSSTKRTGSQGTNLDALIAKAERTGELPDDFETRTKVLNAIAEKDNSNKPAWHRR